MSPSSRRLAPLLAWSAALVVMLLPWVARADVPSPQGRVTDVAGVLDAETRAALQRLIEDTEQATTAEIAVVIVGSLDGKDVERYAEELFRTWGIGKKGVDNGVLVLVCPSERKMRIEVGYGLEGILPDGLAGSLVRSHFTPAFKDGDYSRGVLEGVRRLAEIVRANHVLTAEELRTLEEAEQSRPPRWLMTPFFGLFIALGATSLGMGLRTRSIFALIWGGLFGGIPFVMALIPFFNAALWILVPLAIGLLLLGYLEGLAWMAKLSSLGSSTSTRDSDDGDVSGTRGSSRRTRPRESGETTSGSSWSGGSTSSSRSSGSSSWGSSGSSSSGSSFGGGRSGGGGASGSW